MSPEIINNGGGSQPPIITRRKKKKNNKKSMIIGLNGGNNNDEYVIDATSLTIGASTSLPSLTSFSNNIGGMNNSSNNIGTEFKLALDYGDRVNPLRFAGSTMTTSVVDEDDVTYRRRRSPTIGFVSLPPIGDVDWLSSLMELGDDKLDGERTAKPEGESGAGSEDLENNGNEGGGVRSCSFASDPNDGAAISDVLDAVKRLSHRFDRMSMLQRQMARELNELRAEFEMLKMNKKQHQLPSQQSSLGCRDYEPGMLSDIVREVREAARVREDALLARVRHVIEEKELLMSQYHLATEKTRNNDRLLRLEEQLKGLTVSHQHNQQQQYSNNCTEETVYQSGGEPFGFSSTAGHHQLTLSSSTSSVRQVMELETENVQLRKELQAQREGFEKKVKELDMMLRQKTNNGTAIPSSAAEDVNDKTSLSDATSTVTSCSLSSSSTSSSSNNSTLIGGANLNDTRFQQQQNQQQQQQQPQIRKLHSPQQQQPHLQQQQPHHQQQQPQQFPLLHHHQQQFFQQYQHQQPTPRKVTLTGPVTDL